MQHNINKFIVTGTFLQMRNVHTGTYSPPFYFRPFHPSCQRANLFASEERRKIHGAIITLYTVLEINLSQTGSLGLKK